MAQTLDIGSQPGSGANGAVGSGQGSAVRIPTAAVPGQPLRDAPPISRWRGSGIPPVEPVDYGKLFEGIENAGEKLGQIFAAQGADQRALQTNKVMQDFSTGDKLRQQQAMTNGSYLPSDNQNMVGQYYRASSDAAEQILNDPANKGILADPHHAQALMNHIAEVAKAGTEQMTVAMGGAALKDQGAQFKTQLTSGAVTAGGDYVVNPDGTIGDGPDALRARQQADTLIQQIKGHMPAEAAADLQAFNADIAAQRGQAIAQNTSQPFLLDKFVKQQPSGTFTPEQLAHFGEVQRSAIKAPYEQVMAVHDAKSAGAIAQLNAMQANHDPNLGAQAYQAKLATLIDDGQYTSYTGAKFVAPNTPSKPGLVQQYTKGIDQNPFQYSSQDIAGISSEDINPNDRRALQAHLHDIQESVKKPLGAAVLNGSKQIRDSLTPTMMEPMPAQKQKIDNALEDFRNASASGQFKTVKDVTDARDQIIKLYGGRATPPPKYTVDPSKIAPTLTPATAAAIANKARAAGFDPSVGE